MKSCYLTIPARIRTYGEDSGEFVPKAGVGGVAIATSFLLRHQSDSVSNVRRLSRCFYADLEFPNDIVFLEGIPIALLPILHGVIYFTEIIEPEVYIRGRNRSDFRRAIHTTAIYVNSKTVEHMKAPKYPGYSIIPNDQAKD